MLIRVWRGKRVIDQKKNMLDIEIFQKTKLKWV